MTDKIMMDGEPLELGDPVWGLQHGDMIVIQTNYSDLNPILCERRIDKSQYTFNRNFGFDDDFPRVLFWQKPEIIPPPKLKKRVKVWDWFVQWNSGVSVRVNSQSKEEIDKYNVGVLVQGDIKVRQKIDGTEREIEQ